MTEYIIKYDGQGNYGISLNGVALTDEMIVTLELPVLNQIKEKLSSNKVLSLFPTFISYIELKEKVEFYNKQISLISPMRQEIQNLTIQQQKLQQEYLLKVQELETAKAKNSIN